MNNITACRVCGLAHAPVSLEPGTVAECVRCGSILEKRTRNSYSRTAALCLAALILFIPANIFPILHMDLYGATSENTIWDGIVLLYNDGQWIVAGVVFLASMVVPLLKLAGLTLLIISSSRHSVWLKNQRTWLYKFIEIIGRWAMLDVFIVAVLIALVKLERLATIIPGPGLLAFTLVVVLTFLASASFDSQLIWEEAEEAS